MASDRHRSAPPFEDDDGWFYGRCDCGYESGPFPDMEGAVDGLMEHTYYEGTKNPGVRFVPGGD